jgi:hypothetical protein
MIVRPYISLQNYYVNKPKSVVIIIIIIIITFCLFILGCYL